MAVLAITSFKWKQKVLNMGGTKLPLAYAEVELSANPTSSDSVSQASLQAMLNAWPTSLETIGSIACSYAVQGSMPGFPTNTGNYDLYSFTPGADAPAAVQGRNYAIRMNGANYSGGHRCTVSGIVNGSNTTDILSGGGLSTGSRSICFGPKFLVFDKAHNKILVLMYNWDLYEFHMNVSENVIGIINYENVPIAACVPTHKTVGADVGLTVYSSDMWLGFFGYYCKDPATDPYADVPTSGQSASEGTHDWTSSDIIDFPGNPGKSAVNTGFISLWSPTEQQMLDLSGYMWNADILTIEFWKKLWADPLEVIYGLNIIPIDFRATGRDIIGGTDSVVVGLVNTNVEMDYLKEQWIELDCGSISLAEVWGAYLDYDPYTKLEIYLPYCGIHPLRVDDFMSGTISLKYKIDLLSGACVALIKADKPNDDDNDLSSIVYQFMGNCATQVPVTASQFADAVRSVISLAASVGTMIATSGAGAAANAAGTASAASKAALAERTIHNSAAVVENVMNIKPGIERSGAIGAAAGLLGVQTPYLIITRPRQAHPADQNKYTGYPSFITETLGDLEGWTVVKDIHLENIPCTADELSEIDGLLKSGVIF